MYNLQSFQVYNFVYIIVLNGGIRESTNIFYNLQHRNNVAVSIKCIQGCHIFWPNWRKCTPSYGKKEKIFLLNAFQYTFTRSSYQISMEIHYSRLEMILRIYQDIWEVQCNTIIVTMEPFLETYSNLIENKTNLPHIMCSPSSEPERKLWEILWNIDRRFWHELVACHTLLEKIIDA